MAKRIVSNATVEVSPGEDISRAISRFKKKCRYSGVYNATKKYYMSKSESRRQKKHSAKSRRRKYKRKQELKLKDLASYRDR